MEEDSINSMCAVWAYLARAEIEDSQRPDMEMVKEMLRNIEKHCGVVPFEKGETPDHLEEHLFEPGE